MEYLFRQKDDYEDSTVLARFQGDFAPEIVAKFREFLSGCGFHQLVIDRYVPDPERTWTYDDVIAPDTDGETVQTAYMEFDE
jgi:hypothetical protein